MSKNNHYKVVDINHIFYGHIFNGYPIKIGGEARIWDNGSQGRSYPASACKMI